VRDVFAAVFFVSVGMLIDPKVVWAHAGAVIVLTLIVVVGKLVGVSIGAFVAGHGVRTSVQAGLSMGQIGEFSFIIAGVGLSLDVTRPFLYPVAIAVSAFTTLLTPFAIRASGRVASGIERRLPHAVQTYAALYGAWVQGFRSAPEHPTAWSKIRQLVGLLLIDATVIGGLVIAASLSASTLSAWAEHGLNLGVTVTRILLVLATVAVLSPFVLGAVRMARALGAALAAEALPTPSAGLDLAAAPRRALLVTLQIAILLVTGAPIVAITQPFIGGQGMAVLAGALLLLVIRFWRSTANLQGHVRAGAQVILEALATQSSTTMIGLPIVRDTVPKLLPGLGNAQAIKIDPASAVVGRSLRDINLRGLTGATIIAIDREPADVVYPTADEVLRGGDAVVLTGTAEAVSAARDLLAAPAPRA
jgi:CPA2 family monovalent cation:H+ antiporter-2